MKFYLGLLVGSAIFIAVTRARSLDRDEPVQELQTRNLDVVDQPVHGQYQSDKVLTTVMVQNRNITICMETYK